MPMSHHRQISRHLVYGGVYQAGNKPRRLAPNAGWANLIFSWIWGGPAPKAIAIRVADITSQFIDNDSVS